MTAFAAGGFVVDRIGNAESLVDRAQHRPIALMAVVLKKGDEASALCRTLKRVARAVPLLAITGRKEVDEVVQLLDAGADDVIAQPYADDELMARARAAIRRASESRGIFECGPVSIDLHQHLVRVSGRRIDATAREFALLALLIRAEGKVVARSEILAQVWFLNRDAGSNVIDVHIRNLRDKLGTAASLLETVRGRGYRFRV